MKTLHSMSIAGLLAVVLVACPSVTTGSTSKASLTPSKLELSLLVGAISTAEGSKDTGSKEFKATVTLENGHLPSTVFDASKSAWANTINTWSLNDTQKQQLIAGINNAFDRSKQDVDQALDALPDEMQVTPKGNLTAEFKFVDQKSAKSITVTGFFNSSSKEFLLAGISLGDLPTPGQTALTGLTAWGFGGALNKAQADFTQVAAGSLIVQGVGTIGLGASAKTTVSLSAN